MFSHNKSRLLSGSHIIYIISNINNIFLPLRVYFYISINNVMDAVIIAPLTILF